MAIPLLSYPPSSQNQRVTAYEVPGDEQPRRYSLNHRLDESQIDNLIQAAYRQIFNEQQLITKNRQPSLESLLKAGQITVRDFIKGLVVSEPFRRYNYEVNNNYRFVQMCIQRILGREVYNEREKQAWSIVLATKGLHGFIEDLLDSQEYLTNFGDDTVPYQRRRILPLREKGDLPFARMPRYGADYRTQLEAMGNLRPVKLLYRWQWQRPPYPRGVRIAGQIIAVTGGILLSLGVIAVALAAWGLIHL